MARRIAWLVVVALAFGSAAWAGPRQETAGGEQPQQPQQQKPAARDDREQDPNRRKWWVNVDDRKELGITDQQSAALEEIWASISPKQREVWHEFERLEADLAKMLKDAAADPAVVAQKTEKVEKLRAQLNTNRTVMIYRMSLVLKPEQRVKLEALRARREENRRKQSDKERSRHY